MNYSRPVSAGLAILPVGLRKLLIATAQSPLGGTDMKHKTMTCQVASFKALDQAQGIFEAIVAVFGNVDRIGDKILPGAFTRTLAQWAASGDPIPVIFSHEWDNLDAHIGEVLEAKELPEGLYIKGQVEMDEAFAQRVWKKMSKRTLKQFSFAYDEIDSALAKQDDGTYVNELKELELFEVGPTLVGMNPSTQLLGTKKAIASHSTPTSDAAWDGPANETRVKSGENAAYYKRVYAWADPEGDATVKSTYKFPHHEVDADGNPGAANVKACQSGVGVLNGGMGGTTIPDADRQGVYDHMARHLRDADLEPPELKEKAAKASDFATAFRRDRAREMLWEERWDIDRALEESLYSILQDQTLDTPAKLAMLQASCSQFTTALLGWASRAIAAGFGDEKSAEGQRREQNLAVLKAIYAGAIKDTPLDLSGVQFTDQQVARLKAAWEAQYVGASKEGRRNAAKDAARIQQIHDLTLELGAKCAEPSQTDGQSDDEAGDGKSKQKRSSTLAERVAIELLELGVE
ncbi:MAG: HK97 family phage prohead protease [Pseudomonadota bacterium]